MSEEKRVYEKFLNNLVNNKSQVTVFLINGVKLQGVVDSFDDVAVILKKDQFVQLLYKHAISTIIPQE
ncbi:MAG: RNA chaperone Hfq [Holosporales bacterium]|jgi:host factor-I protein|nr:RNA chaperone Hfq [Holosporales bacterium]